MNTTLGIEMGEPMVKMREVVKTLRHAIEGNRTGPRVTSKLPIYLAGVSRPMVKLAGEIADGVIFNFFPPARVKQALGELAEGAKIGNRNVADIEPTLFATAFVSDDLEAARRPARKLLSRYGALRFYGNMLANAGFKKEIEGIRAAGRDEAKAIAAVTDAMIDAALLVGSEERIRERLAELTAPGIGTAIVFVNPVNQDRVTANQRIIRALKT
jgi:5,10-methylenetetrahydromethanopterin reductase